MEDNLLCPSHKCNLMELLPILMDIDTKEEIILLPSELNKELQMSTEERLTRLCKPTRKYRIFTEDNTFSRTPDILVFQNFKPGLLYKTTLSFLNLHSVSRHLKVVDENSPYFEIDGPVKDSSAKLAPGMSYTFNVVFLPTEYKNYIHYITIATDTETFTVPVYGITCQALLNFPDHIMVPPTAVNITSEKKLMLHNFGKMAASFIILAKDPFSASPSKYFLPAGQFTELIISCKSPDVGLIKDCIYLSYNYIKIMAHVECEIYTVNTYLDEDSILFEDLYMGLKRHESVTLYNRSDHFIDFKWKLYKSFAIDQSRNSKMVANFETIKELEKKRSTKLEAMDVIDKEGHAMIYENIFENEVEELKSSNLYLYQNTAFDIIPLVGRVLPRQSQIFTVTFAPNKNEDYESCAYLDVAGSSSRLPLKLSGKGRGPYVSLNVKLLNVGDIVLCATHNYEVAVKNEGNIPATVVFKDCISDFKGIIKCVPRKLRLPYQDNSSAFIISFYSEFKGTFIETIEFMVKESEEIIRFVLSGNVICPLLKTDIQGIDFGVFAFGVQQMKEFVLKNVCQVPIEFKIVLEENNICNDNEIQFDPDKGVVAAYTDQPISVRLNICRSKEVNTNFKVVMWGSELYSFSKFVKYTCVCPNIKCDPSDIKVKFCFINFGYKRTITLKNEDNVSGVLTYTPDKPSEDSGIICHLSKTEFEIRPYQWEEIELFLMTKNLGISHLPLMFTVAGSEPQALCKIMLDGQGPVISYRPEDIQFNAVTLLQTVVKELTLINDSPIPATVHISKLPDSVYELDVEDLYIQPDEEKLINVSVYLTDVGKFTSTITVNVENGESIDIKVFGEGVGHSLLCDPILVDEYNVEAVLTHQQITLPVKITNMGRRYYKVRWTSKSHIKHLKDKLEEPNPGYCFNIRPEYFELSNLQSQVFEISGLSKYPRQVEEEFFCYALVDKVSKMCPIMSFVMKAQFVDPLLSIQKPVIDVLIPEGELIEIRDKINIVNHLTIPLSLNIRTTSDYFIGDTESYDSQIAQSIEANGLFSVNIKFAPIVTEKRYFKKSGSLTITYANHPSMVKLDLTTEVCYPTLSLNESELEFGCVPLYSHSCKNVILKNITFLPATYSWEILEEFFHIEILPPIKDECEDEPGSDLEDEMKKISENPHDLEELFIGCDDVQSHILGNHDQATSMRKILLPTVHRFMEDSNEQDLFGDIHHIAEFDEFDFTNILTIQPFCGQLDPYEYGVVTVGFFPPPNTRIHAKAICKVEGGAQETLTIVGTSSKISYKFDKKYVEFGNQLFCEICEETIVLTNNGYCIFNFSISSDDFPEDGSDLEPEWLNITPSSGSLAPGNSATLKIKYFPGMVGEFKKPFRVMLGYINPFDIKIHGYAVFSQIFAYVPRPQINSLPVALSYGAISVLTMCYLNNMRQSCTIKNVPNKPTEPEAMPQLDEDWVVVSKDVTYPNEVDIDLSIERLLVAQHVIKHPHILRDHTFIRKSKVIPDFKVPPYLLDFGYVIVEKSVCYTISLLNYGPIPTEIKLVKNGLSMEKNKFKIEYTPKKLEIGESEDLHVLFRPTLKRFSNQDVNVKESFCLAVTHGATIPVLINATVTLPRLHFGFKSIEFGCVRIGQCLRKSLVMKNNGYVPCKWSTDNKKKHTYYVYPREGELLPGRRGILDIYFAPTEKDQIRGKLHVHIEGNPKKTIIDLCGYGAQASLVFNYANLEFQSALPYTKDNVMIFIIQNVYDTPIEFCFGDFNEQYALEKLWINTYFNSHSVNGVLVPEREAGEKLNSIFQENYLAYISELRKKVLKVEQCKSEESEKKDDVSDEFDDPLSKYSPREILKMLIELIESEPPVVDDAGTTDIYGSCFPSELTVVEPHIDKITKPKKLQSGTFIIFHGGPYTEYLKAANWTSMKLKMPVYSIDRLIYEALVENQVSCANEINKIIEEEFANLANSQDFEPVPEEDEYDILMRKVQVVLYRKKKTKDKGTLSKNVAKVANTLGDISVELFEDLLRYKFRSLENAVIIESLHSDFLRKMNLALHTLLRAIGNSRYIHIIMLSYTLQNFIKDEEEKEAERQKIREELKAKERDLKGKQPKKTSRETSTSRQSSKKSKNKNEKSEQHCCAFIKNMTKDEKEEFDSFQELLSEVNDLCQFWDRKTCTRNKQGTKSLFKVDVDTKENSKDSKSIQHRKNVSCDGPTEEVGIPLWVINHAHKEKPINFSEIIYNSLMEDPDLLDARQDLAEGLEEDKDSVLFTIITRPEKNDTGKSDFFFITTIEQMVGKKEVDEGTSIVSSMSLLSGGKLLSRRKTGKNHKITEDKNQQTSTPVSKAPTICSEQEVLPFEQLSRNILLPDQVAYYMVTFCPQKCGTYKHNFTIQLTGLNSDYILNCSAVCELPRIDLNPHVLYPNVVANYRDKAISSNFVYIKNAKLLDFGLVFFDPDKPRQYQYKILLKNISQLPCEIQASLEEKSPYFLPSQILTIDPGQEAHLPISVKSTKSHTLESDLCISIKNNPKAKIVKLVTKPSKMDFYVKPRMLTFDKVPVQCGLKKKVSFCNLSPANLFWKFVDINWALQVFEISRTEGQLGPFSVTDITFLYAPKHEESYLRKQLNVQVFDTNYSMESPVYVDYLTVNADSVEYIVEYSDHIDLEEIQGRKKHFISFTLMNRGQHPTNITLAKIDNPLDKDGPIRNCFELVNINEILYPNKLFTGGLIFNAEKQMVLKEVPIFVCNFVENTHPEIVMNSIIFKVSGTVFLSRFEINPSADINFGHQQILSMKTHTIQLKNTGRFPFTYLIACSGSEVEHLEKPSPTKNKPGTSKDEKKSKTSGSKMSKAVKPDRPKTKLSWGCFSIQPTVGDIMPNEVAQIEVECFPENTEEYKGIITLFVSEPLDEDIKGRQITLNVIGCEPKLAFHNFKKIFKEHYIVDKLENISASKIVGDYCIYESSEQTLHYKKVSVNTKAVSNIHMQNTGHVVAYVTAKISDGNQNVFKVTPTSMDVEPFSTKSLSIIFKPDCVGESSCKLDITYNSSTNNKFSLAVIGEGVMPKLMLNEPNLQDSNKTSIEFLPTYIGCSMEQKISLKNVGCVTAKAILQIYNNRNEVLSLIACADTCGMLNVCNLAEFQNTKYSTLVNLQPEETANFNLIYKPKCEEGLNATIKIYTVNNPFEVFQITVEAQSYYRDICFEGLAPFITGNVVGYKINFGYAFLNYLQKNVFTIKNNAEQCTYKFEFAHFGPLLFVPRVGHLKPQTKKDIIITFCAEKPQHYERELIECTIHKLEYVYSESERLAWDERLMFVAWEIPINIFSDKCNSPCYGEDDEESMEAGNFPDITRFATVKFFKQDQIPLQSDVEIQRGLQNCSNIRGVSFKISELVSTFVTTGVPQNKIFRIALLGMRRSSDNSEPEFTVVPDSSDIIPCLFSITADYASYENKVYDISFSDIYINERIRTEFEIKNNGTVPLEIEWHFNFVEAEEQMAESAEQKNSEAHIEIDASHPAHFNCSAVQTSEQDNPFSITPQKISIDPDKIQEFSVQFLPLKFMEYRMMLQSNIVGLKPQLKNINIKVKGNSLLPSYYFELEESTYLSRRPDGVKKCNVSDYPNSKIIEFESVGTGVTCVRKFNIVNPSHDSFTFKYESLEQYPPFSYFDCKTGTGFVREGKKSEIIFTFKSQEFGNFEAYFMFQIAEKKINIPFLLAGRCRQPVVHFTESHIEMKPTILMVPKKSTVMLVNDEDMELSFKFHKETFLNEYQDQELVITPRKGKLGPRSETIIDITFKAEKTGDENFYVLCTIGKLPSPITLNIFVQCEEVSPLITYWDKFDVVTVTLDKDIENVIDFGMITPRKRETLKLTVYNNGITGFFYTVQYNVKTIDHAFHFDVREKKEFVASHKTATVIMYLEALRRATLKNFQVKINISYGPKYVLNINAKAETPLVKFSFHTYDFGHCIVQTANTTYYNVSLELKNIGTRVLMLENCYENSENLTVDFKSGRLQPSSTQNMIIYFHPLSVRRYEIDVPLKINSVKSAVKIMGEAVDINLELVNTDDKYIDLGGIMVGTAKTYAVQVINRTPTHVNVFFDLWQRLPFHTRPREKIYSEIKLPELSGVESRSVHKIARDPQKKKKLEDSKKAKIEKKKIKSETEGTTTKTSKKSQKADKKKKEEVVQEDILELIEPPKKTALDFLKVTPRDCVHLGPGKKYQFTVDFTPTEKTESFSEKIFYEIQDHVEPLCVVSGYCIAPKFVLSQYHLKFSNVVAGLKHTIKTLLRNVGDFKGRFQWTLDKKIEVFNITPMSGYVGSGSELEILVSFEPKVVDCSYKTKAQCLIKGLEKSLDLILEANSTKVPSPISTLQFTSPVREKTQQQIKIVNITKERWVINSFVSSDQFSTESALIVEPDADNILDVVYKPEIMTTLAPHNATLFLPLPEGKAIIYKLIGQTLPPLPLNKIKLDIKCKMYHTQPLLIRNWTNTKQCFKVTTELMTRITPKCLYKVSGNPLVDLFPNETKYYNWKVYIINDIPLDFQVVFTNIENAEYMYYEISVNILPSDPLQTKKVTTCVRKPVDFTILLENPIDHPVTFTIDCDLAETVFDQFVTVEPYSRHSLPLQYCPLKSDEITTNLYATCPELGTYSYSIKLIAKPPLPENTVKFTAELGEKVYRSVLWKNTFKASVEFSAKCDHSVFSMEKLTSIPEGESGRIKFSFEPSQLGILQSKAVLFSSQTGNYIYPLIGECVLPTPKGPFSVKPGGSSQINFVNPYLEDQTFNFEIDSNAFYLKTSSETIKAKKSTKIVVNMQALKNLDGNIQPRQITAKLHVAVDDASMDNIKWLFYIQGDI